MERLRRMKSFLAPPKGQNGCQLARRPEAEELFRSPEDTSIMVITVPFPEPLPGSVPGSWPTHGRPDDGMVGWPAGRPAHNLAGRILKVDPLIYGPRRRRGGSSCIRLIAVNKPLELSASVWIRARGPPPQPLEEPTSGSTRQAPLG